MADSAAVRKRRSRAHGAGDHRLCKPGCTPAAASSAVADTVRELVGALRLGPGDRWAPTAALATLLAAKVDAGKARPTELSQLRLLLGELRSAAATVPPIPAITDAEIAAVLGEWEEEET
jgi:hypothetical protein